MIIDKLVAAESVFKSLAVVSLSVSAAVIPLLLFAPLTDRRWRVAWRYAVFAIFALRLLIPVHLNLPIAAAPLPISHTARDYINTAGQLIRTPAVTVPVPLPVQQVREPAGFTMSLLHILTIIWILGMSAVLLCHIARYAVYTAALSRHRTPAGCSGRVKIYETDYAAAPLLIGYIKPAIYLPQGMYTAEEREKVIAHELIHFKRGDLWAKLLFMLALSAHWFNPVIHLMVSRASRDMEYSCDDKAVKNRDTKFLREYSDTILKTINVKGDIK